MIFGNVNYKSRDLNVGRVAHCQDGFTIDILRSYITGVFVQVCRGICVDITSDGSTSDNENLCPARRTKTCARQFEIKTTEIDL